MELAVNTFRAEILRREKMREANTRVRVLVKPDVAGASLGSPSREREGRGTFMRGAIFSAEAKNFDAWRPSYCVRAPGAGVLRAALARRGEVGQIVFVSGPVSCRVAHFGRAISPD